MTDDLMQIQIAAAPVQSQIPKDQPLKMRVEFAMRYVREHESDLFWMSARTDDNMLFRTALAAVMLAGDESDRDIISRSMKPLKRLSAATQGIPVDWSAFEMTEDMLPLMRMFNDAKKSTK